MRITRLLRRLRRAEPPEAALKDAIRERRRIRERRQARDRLANPPSPANSSRPAIPERRRPAAAPPRMRAEPPPPPVVRSGPQWRFGRAETPDYANRHLWDRCPRCRHPWHGEHACGHFLGYGEERRVYDGPGGEMDWTYERDVISCACGNGSRW